MDEYEAVLVMKFLDQRPSYTYGFEAGGIYKELELGIKKESYVVNSENMQQYALMAERFKLGLVTEPSGVDGWIIIRFVPKKPTLTIVK